MAPQSPTCQRLGCGILRGMRKHSHETVVTSLDSNQLLPLGRSTETCQLKAPTDPMRLRSCLLLGFDECVDMLALCQNAAYQHICVSRAIESAQSPREREKCPGSTVWGRVLHGNAGMWDLHGLMCGGRLPLAHTLTTHQKVLTYLGAI